MAAGSTTRPTAIVAGAPAASLGSDSLETALPAMIGKYRVLRKLGTGAMGVVYECLQEGLGRHVAVKVMRAGNTATAEEICRFQREARSAAQLTHPSVVRIYDVGAEAELHFIVMEFVDGVSLDKLIATEYLTLETSLRLLYHTAQALHAAHQQGIVHRDLKPSNILVDTLGRPRIADFGLAKSVSEERSLSGSGDLIGTPRYMSPEQVVSACEEVDGRSDIFSLGSVMYEMLAGRGPFDGQNVLAILRQVVDEEPAPLSQVRPELRGEVVQICVRAMAKEREQRFQTAAEMAGGLRAALLKELGTSSDHGALDDDHALIAFVPPTLPRKRRASRWAVRGALAAAVAAVLLSIYPVWQFARGTASSEVSAKSVPAPTVAYPKLRAQLTQEATQQLSGPLRLTENQTPRDSVKSVVEDLTVLLRQSPDDAEVRLLRGRAYRRGGEYLAAVDDLSAVLRSQPANLPALADRLLANYQLYVLYLGNLNEPALRLPAPAQFFEDAKVLQARGDASQKYLAGLAEFLARQEDGDVEKLLAQRPSPPTATIYLPDLLLLETDLLFRASEQSFDDPPPEGGQPSRSAHLSALALRTLRRGLDADPNHVGLLFLKANSFQRRAIWETGEGEDRDTAVRRSRPQFEASSDRLRRATLRTGCDTAIARAVLLDNLGWNQQAYDQVQEALACRPTVTQLYAIKAWLKLKNPEDGTLEETLLGRIGRDLEPAFESPPEEFQPYLIRGLLRAAAGHWDDARRDIKDCARRTASGGWPGISGTHLQWLQSSSGATTEYLYATHAVLDELAVPPELRIRLLTKLLAHIQDASAIASEGLEPERARTIRAWSHFSLAASYAAQENRASVLQEVRSALEQKVADLTPQTFKDNGTFSGWNEDAEFVALYQQFQTEEPKP